MVDLAILDVKVHQRGVPVKPVHNEDSSQYKELQQGGENPKCKEIVYLLCLFPGCWTVCLWSKECSQQGWRQAEWSGLP